MPSGRDSAGLPRYTGARASEGWPSDRTVSLLFGVFLAVSSPVFALFVYNTGYGNDQLEYLVAGRAIARGAAMYDFIPSKSFGIYALVAGLWKLGVDFEHASRSVLITLVYLSTALLSYRVFARRFGRSEAAVVAVLVAVCSAFMAQNYFQPEGFVYLCGLLAFFFTSRAIERQTRRDLFLAGAAIALGFHFKAVAAFYGIGVVLFAFLWHMRSELLFRALLRWGTWLACGFAVVLLPPFLYFTATGRLEPLIEWTVTFPIFHYPRHTLYLHSFLYKLIWFNALVLLALALSLRASVRREVYGSPFVLLALCMGGCSLMALIKSQTSAYLFPAAGFLLVFSVHVLVRTLSAGSVRFSPRLVVLAGVGALLMVASVAIYRPAAFQRLASVNDYEQEETLQRFLRSHLSEEGGALFVTKYENSWLYWIADRTPLSEIINISVQATYRLREEPELLLSVLDDPKLELVEYDPEKPRYEDEFFLDYPEMRALMLRFEGRLEERFRRVSEELPGGLQFWVPKPRGAHAGS